MHWESAAASSFVLFNHCMFCCGLPIGSEAYEELAGGACFLFLHPSCSLLWVANQSGLKLGWSVRGAGGEDPLFKLFLSTLFYQARCSGRSCCSLLPPNACGKVQLVRTCCICARPLSLHIVPPSICIHSVLCGRCASAGRRTRRPDPLFRRSLLTSGGAVLGIRAPAAASVLLALCWLIWGQTLWCACGGSRLKSAVCTATRLPASLPLPSTPIHANAFISPSPPALAPPPPPSSPVTCSVWPSSRTPSNRRLSV